MEIKLRQVLAADEARELAPRIEARAAEVLAEYRDVPLPADVGRRFVERHFAAPQTVLLVAESEEGEGDLGLCLVGPLEDPLTAERLALVLVLHVEPAFRRRGLARALVTEARAILAARGIDKIAARAAHNDDALISMGERWGYVRQWELMLLE